VKRIIREAIDQQGNVDADQMGSASDLAAAMNDEWMSQSEFAPGEWANDQDGVWVEAVVAEYMDKLNMPQEWSTTGVPMDVMRKEALDIFLTMDD
jgi:hypothetical protein